MYLHAFSVFLLILGHFRAAQPSAIEITNDNFEETAKKYDLLVVDFYASWCYYSQLLDPIFNDAAQKVEQQYKNSNAVALAKVNCEKEEKVAQSNNVRKYPTIKVFRFGRPMKQEYRGARTADAFLQFVADQLRDPLIDTNSPEFSQEKPHILGTFRDRNSAVGKLYQRVAMTMRDQCTFAVHEDKASTAPDSILFKSNDATSDSATPYPKPLGKATFSALLKWASSICVPAVRELTFMNAEEITEEGLPLILLFSQPDDTASIRAFNRVVSGQLADLRGGVNFVHANGRVFQHPLMHLGKSLADLPLLVCDSFQHMYVFPRAVSAAWETPRLLREFVEDLHSGKLHREYHNGPDPTTPTPPTAANDATGADSNKKEASNHVPRDVGEGGEARAGSGKASQERKSPPESVFKKLKPADNRYTMIGHDEF